VLKNYLIVAFRSIQQHKAYSIINIIGLAIGIAACLLLFLWVQDELSYDQYHEKAYRIYRVISQYKADGVVDKFAKTPAPLGPALVNEFPEVEKAVRFGENEFLVSYQNRLFHEYIFFADPEIFDVFTFPLIEGNPHTALSEPYSILISEEIRDKYFAGEEPVGKIITLNETRDCKVTGVFKNIPHNSHFRFNFLGCFSDYASRHFWKNIEGKSLDIFISLPILFSP
jgi:putative ABC transport system permease protein